MLRRAIIAFSASSSTIASSSESGTIYDVTVAAADLLGRLRDVRGEGPACGVEGPTWHVERDKVGGLVSFLISLSFIRDLQERLVSEGGTCFER